MAIGAKPAGAFFEVAPRMTIRNSAVMTTSDNAHNTSKPPVSPDDRSEKDTHPLRPFLTKRQNQETNSSSGLREPGQVAPLEVEREDPSRVPASSRTGRVLGVYEDAGSTGASSKTTRPVTSRA